MGVSNARGIEEQMISKTCCLVSRVGESVCFVSTRGMFVSREIDLGSLLLVVG